jgi:hypothetical protein
MTVPTGYIMKGHIMRVRLSHDEIATSKVYRLAACYALFFDSAVVTWLAIVLKTHEYG